MTKNHLKALVFTILDIFQLKKLMIVYIFIVYILCICVLIMQTDRLKRKVWINLWFLTLQMKIKIYLKKYNDAFNGIRDKIKEINSDECDYEKDYVKINLLRW